ncbi:MAG: polysaccharide pyruvyl transferase CsaB [Oscillospiraceae bacterium]|nr:polysaccharide pyruvyl transferase CsaB [Oscillospiraceae bacterium]
MKIIHMISGGDVGGAKTHVLSLLSGLNKTESAHLICFTEGDFAAEARQLGIPTTVIEDGNLLRTSKRILAMIRHDGCQVVHCHGARANMMGMLLRKKVGIPIISTIHSDYRLDYMGRPLAALTYGNINKIALRRFDGWVGVSRGMTKLLISRGFNPQTLYTLYNGVDFSQKPYVIPKEEYLKSIGLNGEKDSVIFGIAARINPVKDMSTLIHAFAKAVGQCPNIRLVIAGEGEQETEIRALAAQLCPEGTVTFAGWVKDMNSFYNALDVNLLTSLSETFPYALTEGARMCCATISSAVGGVPDLIDNGINGFLFTPRDAETLAKHMIRLAQDATLREKMGQALYEKTRREFSLEAMVEKQKQIYATLLRRKARSIRSRDGVVICGAYGKGNCGDNAILDAIVEQFHQLDPDLPLTALSRSPKETRICTGINAVYTFNVWKIARLMRRSKLYISGGGTLMQDATSTRSLLYYLFSIHQAARNGCRVMLYGCGIGPVSRPRNQKRTAKTLNRYADIISVRDGYSIDFLEKIQVHRPEIYLNADPALLIDPPDTGELHNYLHASGLEEGKQYMLLAVRPWPGFEEKISAFAAAAQYAYSHHGLIPLLYAMEPKRDNAAVTAVSKHLSCPHLCLSAGSSGEEVIALIRRMSLVVSMRLHALIFAAGQGVSMVGVVYDPKVSGFLDHLGQDLYLPLEEVNATNLGDFIDAAIAERKLHQESIVELRKLCLKNTALAAKLLEL